MDKKEEFIDINKHIDTSNKDKYFSNKSVLIFFAILSFSTILSLLIICLVKFFL